MISTDMLVRGVALPGGVSALIVVVLAQPWRRAARPTLRAVAAPCAAGLGCITGHAALFGFPAFPPGDTWHWLVYLTVAATVVACVRGLTRSPEWLVRGLSWVILAFLPWMLVKPLLPMEDGASGMALRLGGLALGVMAFFSSLEGLGHRRHSVVPLLAILLIATAAGRVLLDSANGRLAQLAGVLASAIGPVWLTAVALSMTNRRAVVEDLGATRGVACIATVHVCGLLMLGYTNNFGEVPGAAFLVLAAAPALVWVMELPRVRGAARWKSGLAAALMIAVAAGGAVMLSARGAAGGGE